MLRNLLVTALVALAFANAARVIPCGYDDAPANADAVVAVNI